MVVPVSLTATAPRDGAKDLSAGNVRLRKAQENRVMKIQTANQVIALGCGDVIR